MRPARYALALAAVLGPFAGPAAGQTVLTLSDVLARAREQAPAIVSARLAIEEARGRLVGASLRRTTNPEVDAVVGNRQGAGERMIDLEIGVSQAFEPGSRRDARVAGANAGIERSTASLDETTRLVMREAARAFYRALHASERIRLLTTAKDLAVRVRQTAERRYQAGDIAVLDVNVARAGLARVRSDRKTADAELAAALGDLKAVLGLDTPVQLSGTLAAAEPPPSSLLETALLRPELKELDAAVREAEAEIRLGQSFQKPEFGVGAQFARDEGDRVLSGGLKISFPAFNSGQELRATGTARANRLRADLERARTRIRLEVEAAEQTYSLRRDAVRVLETEALPGLDENDALASRSYEVGQIGLAEMLLIRRDILETRFQYIDALLEASLARIDLLTTAGVLR
jgi:cobalt-zinc-cadmium efflux system outer membrane protein